MAKLFLGINNCFAVKRWPEAEAWTEIVSSELELDLVQFSFDLLDPRSERSAVLYYVERLKDACKEHGIRIHSTFTGLAAYSFNLLMHPYDVLRRDAFDWYVKAIEVTSLMEVKATGGHVGAMSWRDYLDEKRRNECVKILMNSLKELSWIAKRYGLNMILWEPMPVVREPPHTINQALKMIEEVNKGAAIPIRYCIDLGHACAWKVERKEDRDPYAWLEQVGKYSPVIHVQQTDGKADRHWPFTKEYNEKGIIEAKKVIETLDKSGAQEVYLMLEIIHPFEEKEEKVLQDLKESVKYWKEYI